jgi:hypothetical protein
MNRLALKVFVIGVAALVQISCSDVDNGNASETSQPAAGGQEGGSVMDLQNGPSAHPLGVTR